MASCCCCCCWWGGSWAAATACAWCGFGPQGSLEQRAWATWGQRGWRRGAPARVASLCWTAAGAHAGAAGRLESRDGAMGQGRRWWWWPRATALLLLLLLAAVRRSLQLKTGGVRGRGPWRGRGRGGPPSAAAARCHRPTAAVMWGWGSRGRWGWLGTPSCWTPSSTWCWACLHYQPCTAWEWCWALDRLCELVPQGQRGRWPWCCSCWLLLCCCAARWLGCAGAVLQ